MNIRLLILCCFICIASASKLVVYYGSLGDGWEITFTGGVGREPDYGYTQNYIPSIYFQIINGGEIQFTRNTSLDVSSFLKFNFDIFWTYEYCNLELSVQLETSNSVNTTNMTVNEWNNMTMDMSVFNLVNSNITSITFKKVDPNACDAWISNIYFNNHNETIDGEFTTQLSFTTFPLTTNSISTQYLTTTPQVTTSQLSGSNIPCATNLYEVWDGALENTWTVDYFSALGRAPDGLVKMGNEQTIYVQAQQWGGLTLRRANDTYADLSAYSYLNFMFYWKDPSCTYTIQVKIKQTTEKWGNYISYNSMTLGVWNQITIPLSAMQFPVNQYLFNQIQIQKTDIMACDAYVTQVEFGDGVRCAKASIISYSFVLLIVIFILI